MQLAFQIRLGIEQDYFVQGFAQEVQVAQRSFGASGDDGVERVTKRLAELGDGVPGSELQLGLAAGDDARPLGLGVGDYLLSLGLGVGDYLLALGVGIGPKLLRHSLACLDAILLKLGYECFNGIDHGLNSQSIMMLHRYSLYCRII